MSRHRPRQLIVVGRWRPVKNVDGVVVIRYVALFRQPSPGRTYMPQSFHRFRMLLAAVAAVFLTVVSLTGPAWASASGTIKGQVLDESELPIPGTLLTLSSDKLIGGAIQYTSDADGNFVFAELPPGPYKVVAQKQGFGDVTKNGISVAVGRTTSVNIGMKYGGETVIVVEKSKVVDTEQASHTTTFNRNYLDKVPSGRDYLSVISNTAQVLGGGNASAAGAAGNENTWMMDGINVTDPVTGTFSQNFNFDAIEEIRVTTGGYDPEYGASLGAVFEVITRSGGNTLEMYANAEYENGDWSPKTDGRYGTDGALLDFADFDSSFEGGTVGLTLLGPIVRDRVWFIGSYQYSRYLFANVGIDQPRDFDGHYGFAKLTMQPVSKHRISLQMNLSPTSIDNIDQGDRYTLPEAQARQMQGGYVVAAKWNWFFNEDANLETTVSLQKTFIEQSGVPCTHDEALDYNPCAADEAENDIDYNTPGRVGAYGAYNRDNFTNFTFDDRWHAEASTKFSVLNINFLGKHDLKAGIDVNYSSWDQVFGFTGNIYYVDLYENQFDPETLKNFYFVEYSGYSRYKADAYSAAGFVQDVYKPVDNLTFRYGLRYDQSQVRNDAGDPIVDVGVFGPRVYSIWDPWSDEKTAIAAGYGRFNDLGRLSVASYLSRSNLAAKIIYDGNFDNGTNYASQAYLSESTDNAFTYGDLSAPHSDEFTASVQREVVTDVRAKVSFTGKFTRNIYTFDETNLVYDEDGYSYVGVSEGFSDFNAYYRLRSPAIARRDYYAVDFELLKAESKRWFATATYSYVSSRGTTQNSLSGGLSNPSQVELMYGELGSDITHQLKTAAYWEIPNDPWTTQVGMQLQGYSGSPYSRYYWQAADTDLNGGGYGLLKEPLGSYTDTPGYWSLNVLVKQEIVVPKGKLSVRLDFANLTNNNYTTSYNSGYIAYQNRYAVTSHISGLSGTLGVGYEY